MSAESEKVTALLVAGKRVKPSTLAADELPPLTAYDDEPAAKSTVFEWSTPEDLWAPIQPTPPLPRNVLPPVIENFALGKPETFSPPALAAAALATCSMATSDHIRLVINSDWRESFRLWVGIVGLSSATKSPIIKAANGPLVTQDLLRSEQHQRASERYDTAKKAAKKDGVDFDDPKPIRERYLTNSATIEALSEILKHTPHGVGLVHDELSALISQMDGYKEKSAGERGDWLKLYDGGPHNVDRITRGEIFVPNHSACMLGAITLDKLASLVRNMVADGLMSRLALVNTPLLPPSSDMGPIPEAVNRAYAQVVARLCNSRPSRDHDVTLADDARDLLGDAKARWQARAQLYCERLPRYSERLGKLTGLAARTALGFAIIEEASNFPGTTSIHREVDPPRGVSADQMRRACAWVDYLSQHDLAFYEAAAGQAVTPPIDLARRVADWLLQTTRMSFYMGDVTRGVNEWRAAESKSDQHAAMDLLDQMGWVHPEKEPYFAGRTFVRGIKWSVNPAAHRIFAARAEAARRVAADAKRRLDEALAARKPSDADT